MIATRKLIACPEVWLIVALVGLSPLLVMQAYWLLERPHFQFFPLAWSGFAWMVYANTSVVGATNTTRRTAGAILCGLAVLFVLVAGLRLSPWAAQVAAILLLLGWSLIRLEGTPWTRLVAWSALLWITVPLPLGYDSVFIQRLQQISSESSAHMLDLLGTPHLRLGNLIELRSGKLFVDEACSGVDSFYSLAAIAILIVVLQRTSLLVAAIVLALVPAWAWFGNMTRLTLIAWLLDTWQIDLSHGTAHTFLGLATFATSAVALLLTNQFLNSVAAAFATSALPRDNPFWHNSYNAVVSFPGERSAKSSKSVESTQGTVQQPTVSHLPVDNKRITQLFFASAMVCLLGGGLSLWNLQHQPIASRLPHFDKSIVDAVVSADVFPQRFGDVTLVSTGGEERNPDSMFGEYSRYWIYKDVRSESMISLDFPFRGFHALWMCYQNSGQTLVGSQKVLKTEITNSQWELVEMEFKDDVGSPSYVWFALFDEQGKPVKVPDQVSGGMADAILERLGRATVQPDELEPVTFQCQLLVKPDEALSEDEHRKYERLFFDALPHAVKVSQSIVEKHRDGNRLKKIFENGR